MAVGEERNFGCHSRNRVSSRLSRTSHGTCNKTYAPSADHAIRRRLPIRSLMRLLILDSAGALGTLCELHDVCQDLQKGLLVANW